MRQNNPYSIGAGNAYTAWNRGFYQGFKEGQTKAGTHETFAIEVVKDEAAQRLLEQFILFMQEGGFTSAVMDLSQLEKMRKEMNQVVSDITNAVDAADVLSDTLAKIELI